MYQFELIAFLNQKLGNHLFYVVPSDLLPSRFSLPAGFIVNLSPSNHGGSHWVAIYIDENGHGTYFDSFAMKPRVKTIQLFLRTHCKTLTLNRTQLQSQHSTVCGEYAAMFLLHSFNGLGLRRFLKLFSTNLILNDMLIGKMYARAKNFSH